MQQHEKTCDRRWLGLGALLSLMLTVLIGVTAWGLNRVVETQDEQLRELRNMRSEAAAPVLPGRRPLNDTALNGAGTPPAVDHHI